MMKNYYILLFLCLSVVVPSISASIPTYSQNTTSTKFAGTITEFRLFIEDDIGVSGYIFSFDNGTGTFVNDSWVSVDSVGGWVLAAKTVNSTIGATIRWCVYINDSDNNLNSLSCKDPFTYITKKIPNEQIMINNTNLTYTINESVCGDSMCSGNETGESCPDDCKSSFLFMISCMIDSERDCVWGKLWFPIMIFATILFIIVQNYELIAQYF